MATQLLKPGILVSLKTTIRGGVTYTRRDLAEETIENVERSKWETERVIQNTEEHASAVKLRSTIGSAIRAHCVPTAFGLVCLVSREDELDDEIARQRDAAYEWNRSGPTSQIGVYVLKGRIAETDEEATRAIADEVAGLLAQIESGFRELDVESVRDAANRARSMSRMLEGEQKEGLDRAIDAAREAARAVVKRAIKGSEQGAAVLAEFNLGAIEKARFAFLDLAGVDDEQPASVMPAVSLQRFADLGDDDQVVSEPEPDTSAYEADMAEEAAFMGRV